MLTVYHQDLISSLPKLESLSRLLIRTRYKDFNSLGEFKIIYLNNDGLAYAEALFLKESLIAYCFYKTKNFQLAKRNISSKLSDLETELRFSNISRYLKSSFNKGEDFNFVRIPYSDKIISGDKISEKLNIKNASILDKDTGEVLEDGYHIQKSAEHDNNFSDLYLLRLEVPELIGANEIKIPIKLFKDAISSLTNSLRIPLEIFINPEIVPSPKKDWEKLKKRDSSFFFRQRKKAINGVINYLIAKE